MPAANLKALMAKKNLHCLTERHKTQMNCHLCFHYQESPSLVLSSSSRALRNGSSPRASLVCPQLLVGSSMSVAAVRQQLCLNSTPTVNRFRIITNPGMFPRMLSLFCVHAATDVIKQRSKGVLEELRSQLSLSWSLS